MAAKKKKAARAAKRGARDLAENGEDAQLLVDARAAVRGTQRIASQLHQLIAASLTVSSLRSEPDILASLAGSARGVFDADVAVVSLDSGGLAPMRGVALRGKVPACDDPRSPTFDVQVPGARVSSTASWTQEDWLIAPILEGRHQSRGVVAVRRSSGSEFGAEDKEVLTLLAQMAGTSLASMEQSRAIQNSEARLRVLVETAPVGIVEVDLDGGVRWWNRRAGRLLAWPEYVESDRAAVLFPDSALDGLRQLWNDARTSESVSGRDLDGVEIGARKREFMVSAALLPPTGDSPPSLLTLIDDVTDSRELRAELRHAHTMEVRGQVASRIAHDFNNLLTLISGYAEMLAKELGESDRDISMVRDIQATASRASLLTSQLQTIGRTKSPEPVVFDPAAVIQSNAEVLERILGGKIDLQWSLAEHGGNIFADADQFEQMILNLSINARDAMSDGGLLRIALATTSISASDAAHYGVNEGVYVRLTVADTGVGMDEATRERCFEPLFTTKGPFRGTGMGLASARRFVEESGGAIRCESVVSRGTTFEMIFPVSDAVAQDVSSSVVAPPPRGSATVLLSEDDEDLRRLMSQVLKRNGYQVFEADSGEKALVVAAEHEGSIDLLVSDVVMAEMTGRELAGELQARQTSLRVLIVSGTEQPSVIDGLIEGSADFLAKPFRPSQLIDKVHDLLARQARDT